METTGEYVILPQAKRSRVVRALRLVLCLFGWHGEAEAKARDTKAVMRYCPHCKGVR